MADLTQEQMEAFVENILAPKKVKTDSGEVEQHSLNEQMKALDYLKKQTATDKPQLSRLGVYQIVNEN